MEIYFIRHTRVAVARTVCYGSSDVKTANTYHIDKEKVMSKITIPKHPIVYSSPLTRCHQLAQDLFGHSMTDERLKEYDFGNWELKEWSKIPIREMDFWGKDIVNNRPPDGENMQDVLDRVREFWKELISKESTDYQPVYVISHAGVIRTLICYLLEIPLKNAFRMGLDFGSVTKVSVNDKFVTVDYINR